MTELSNPAEPALAPLSDAHDERGARIALYALCVSFFMIGLDATVVNVAIPAIQLSVRASLTDMVWVNSVYALCYAVPLIVAGRLGDRCGLKRVFLAGLAGFTLASLVCALAPNAEVLIGARAAQGLAAALMAPQTMSLIVHLFAIEHRSAALGTWGAVGGAAMAAGPLVGGLIVTTLGWRSIFLINLPIGIAGFIAALRWVPDRQPHRQHSFDVLGVLLSGASLFALVFAIQNGAQYRWGTIRGPISIGLVAAFGVVCLVVFVLWQQHNRQEPLLPLRLFTHRNFSAASVAVLAMGAAMGGLLLPLMVYLQTGLGYSALAAGATAAPMFFVSSWCAHLTGRIADRVNPALLTGFGFGIWAVGIAVLVWLLGLDASWWLLLTPLLIAGVGLGAVMVSLAGIATRDLPVELVGAASGVFNTTRQVGYALGIAAAGLLLQAGIGSSATATTQITLASPLVMLIVGMGCCTLVRN
ncbi:MAG: DHA2 family efflux MFS transporter permease subunit [Mycobacteriaceae bacterium]|nr:DHA2 family efflux MFS transporter permease subunit [Mycobacteriaceae bacterium]